AGDHAGALAHLEPVESEMHRVGGSHAQWELFEETMVISYLALERFDAALRLVRRGLSRRASPRALSWSPPPPPPSLARPRQRRACRQALGVTRPRLAIAVALAVRSHGWTPVERVPV